MAILYFTHNQLRNTIRKVLIAEAKLASASDIARFGPQLEEWIEVLIDELAESIPAMKEIDDKKKKNMISSLGRAIKVELIGLTSGMDIHAQRRIEKRQEEKGHQKWDKERKSRGSRVQYLGSFGT